MRLNHIDLQVPDVQETAVFFERWFAFEHVSNRHSPSVAILRGDGDFTLVLQRRADDERYPEGFHVGFLLDDVREVLSFHARAREAGLSISDVQHTGRGTLTYLRGPGVLIEVSCRARVGERP
ncbi:MAG TPA: VOC family protein [Polyangiaceae bacterium]|nr:VOC family protein [Polyangiaceae bacterium]